MVHRHGYGPELPGDAVKALVLERQGAIAILDRPAPGSPGADQVRVRIHTVGICGSDVHYYVHGRIGPYVVERPMILGHEASGTVVEVGAAVTHLKPGDRVCMEPGVPDPNSRASRLGIYNVDPDVTFWATPPVDGCLIEEVIHPARFTFKLPYSVSFSEGAMVEPFAIGLQSAAKARIRPGDTAAVIGAGTIGIMVALAALAGGAARVIVSDFSADKLAIAGRYPGVVTVDAREQALSERVAELTGGWGADVVFEASGANDILDEAFAAACPGGAVVLVGIPTRALPLDVAAAQAKELRIETVFRYANQYERAIDLIGSGKVDLKPLVGAVFPFAQGVEAFVRAAEGRPTDVKLQIEMPRP